MGLSDRAEEDDERTEWEEWRGLRSEQSKKWSTDKITFSLQISCRIDSSDMKGELRGQGRGMTG